MKFRTCLALVILVLASMSAQGGINWFNATSNLLYYGDGTTPLTGDQSDSTAGCFVQLIWAGLDDTMSIVAYNSGTGVSGDDELVDWTWVGATEPIEPNGLVPFENFATPGPLTNDYYYVRAWSAPASVFLSGFVPTSLTNRYINSALYQYPGDGEPPQDQDFNFGGAGGLSTTLIPQAVPEPALVSLGLIGLLTVRLLRRRNSA